MKYHIGIDVGGTNLRVGVVQDDKLVYEARAHCDFSGLCKQHSSEVAINEIVKTITKTVQEVINLYPGVGAVGIGFPGFINPDTGILIQSPNLPGLENVDFSSKLSDALKIPVMFENDAAVAAFGEYRMHHHETNSLLYLGLGTGVGGGLVYRDQLFLGQNGVSMEIGHITVVPEGRNCGCGNKGCVEQYSSATGISNSYALATGKKMSAEEVAKLALTGDSDAIQAYQLAGKYLAVAISHAVKILDVGFVVIGGGVSNAWDLMVVSFNQGLDESLIPAMRNSVSIHISNSGDQAGMVGSAMLAKKHFS